MGAADTPKRPQPRLRKAAVVDVPAIHKLIMHYANARQMLPCSLSRLYESLRDFFVYETADGVQACAALHVVWEDLAELRSLAVRPELQGRGIGRMLVEACKEEARKLRLARVFCLTYVPGFFERLGFKEVDKASLPHKVWADCINCPQFPDCGEVPLLCDLASAGSGS
ncbi:MAG TPA: N-acetyltransferase [Planctomycetota bacterium]|nr:N-acetyltransferase [Planctomycetota bacterium]